MAVQGFVPTPESLVDLMVEKLFEGKIPNPSDVLLDPGCGRGAFIEGVLKWCQKHDVTPPQIIGVELDPRHWGPAHLRFLGSPHVKIRRRDYLEPDSQQYNFIVGNPPYVPITGLSEAQKARYRKAGHATARGRFDLYLLFFEKSIQRLAPGGRLVFVTPEKYLYVETAVPLRQLMADCQVEEIRLIPEDSFGELVTYPTVTTVVQTRPQNPTVIVNREGKSRRVKLPTDGSSWLPLMNGAPRRRPGKVLADVCLRISCGVATGADSVFVVDPSTAKGLEQFSHPTLGGRELDPDLDSFTSTRVMLVPYSDDGHLMSTTDAKPLLDYLDQPETRRRLETRTCVTVGRKPWFSFHETPPLADLQRPKILCKDIAETPRFWSDRSGRLIPRHSVYYIVPESSNQLEPLLEYLNGPEASKWLFANCQRAANGFLRLQSSVLKRLPIPNQVFSPTASQIRQQIPTQAS